MIASRRVLVVEDEYLLAKRMADEFARLGVETVGPASSLERALDLVEHGGRGNVTWQVLNAQKKPRLELAWVERGVEMVEQKAGSLRRGFGRELLERALPYQLDAETRLELGKDGMRFWVALPLGNQAGEEP